MLSLQEMLVTLCYLTAKPFRTLFAGKVASFPSTYSIRTQLIFLVKSQETYFLHFFAHKEFTGLLTSYLSPERVIEFDFRTVENATIYELVKQ